MLLRQRSIQTGVSDGSSPHGNHISTPAAVLRCKQHRTVTAPSASQPASQPCPWAMPHSVRPPSPYSLPWGDTHGRYSTAPHAQCNLQLVDKTISSIGGQRHALAGCQARAVRHGLPGPRPPAAFTRPPRLRCIPSAICVWTDGRVTHPPTPQPASVNNSRLLLWGAALRSPCFVDPFNASRPVLSVPHLVLPVNANHHHN